MFRLLLLLCFSFLFLSSSTAALLGLQQLRVVLFTIALLSLLGAAVLHSPRFTNAGRELPMVLLVMLAWIAVIDPVFDPLDYKILLPILAMLLAANLNQALAGIALLPLFWGLLAVYITATFVSFALDGSNVTARGYDAFVRYDLTGSIVTHASLCTIAMIVGMVTTAHSRGGARLVAGIVVVMAGAMVMLTATRTALVTALFFALLSWLAGPNRRRQAHILVLALCGAGVVFAVYSLLISDAFLLRLTSNRQADFSSGRLHSAGYWLSMVAEQPIFGHGIGRVREMMAEGRPLIEGGRYLEWPHNEFLRFFVEGGALGLAFMFILVGGVIALAIRRAPLAPPQARALTLAIAADMTAQCLFQNYFNTIYHATILLLVFALMTSRTKDQPVQTKDAAISRRTSAGASINII